MSAEAARGHLAALARMGVRPEAVHIGGGEPFGDFPRLLAVVRAAREVGLDGVGYVETSGVWAVSDREVRARLEALAAAGMRQLAISADPYHQEFVPPERLRRLYRTAREVLGPGGVRARRWRWLQAPRNLAHLAEPQRRRLFAEWLRRYPERMTGRAAEALSPLVPRTPLAQLDARPCPRALAGADHVHILPGGGVYPGTCAGLLLGRADAETPLDEVIRRSRLRPPPTAALLAERGPAGLLAEARRLGFAPDPQGYADACHLCWSLRRFLVRRGAAPADVGPTELYESP